MPFLFILLLMADQLTKLSVVMFASKINLTVVQNSGIAFGMLGEKSSLVLLITASLIVLLFIFRKQFFLKNIWHKNAISFILAGGAGNLIDRVLYGHVVDFIKIPFIPYFNLADLFINIGMILYLIGLFKKNASSI